MAKRAQIQGKVEYREGDGPAIVIRRGPIEVETTDADATLSWRDGDVRGSAAIPLSDFRVFVAKGLIALEPEAA